ncbi:hypothetical protein Ciccas_002857 [Cichlidogyrus casuarinus]|uniref:IQ motif containing B1 n=1 Tax=Cichlidogyrus casuarinus TaxID=1844966 RepID=A0ABD2QG17_9PLAT
MALMTNEELQLFRRDMLGYVWFMHREYNLSQEGILNILDYTTDFYKKLFTCLDVQPNFIEDLLTMCREKLDCNPIETNIDASFHDREIAAALMIQSWWRMCLKRRAYCTIKSHYELPQVKTAVLVIQRSWRRHKLQSRRVKAAIKIQRWWQRSQMLRCCRDLRRFMISDQTNIGANYFAALRRLVALLAPSNSQICIGPELQFLSLLKTTTMTHLDDMDTFLRKIENKLTVLRSLGHFGLQKAISFLESNQTQALVPMEDEQIPYHKLISLLQLQPQYVVRLLESMPECLFHNCDAMQNFQRVVVDRDDHLKDYPIFAGQLQHFLLNLFNWSSTQYDEALFQHFYIVSLKHIICLFSLSTAPIWLEFICSTATFSAFHHLSTVHESLKDLLQTLNLSKVCLSFHCLSLAEPRFIDSEKAGFSGS